MTWGRLLVRHFFRRCANCYVNGRQPSGPIGNLPLQIDTTHYALTYRQSFPCSLPLEYNGAASTLPLF